MDVVETVSLAKWGQARGFVWEVEKVFEMFEGTSIRPK